MDDPIESLVSLGFTQIEAAVYSFLLHESPATGYRIAQGIGKQFANTYKAITSLQAKGMILVHEGESKLCRAVPPVEIMDQLKRTFLKRRANALKTLSGVIRLSADFGVYQLASRDQVMERFRVMLKECKEVAICTIFPRIVEEVRADLEAAAKRRLKIAITVYEPVSIKGVDVILESRRREVLRRWPGQWLNLVVDGKEHLIALLDDNGTGVHHALWTGNLYLSWIYHSAVSAALIGTVLSKQIEEGAPLAQLQESLRHFRKFLTGPGYQLLQEQLFSNPSKIRHVQGEKEKRRKLKSGSPKNRGSIE